MTVNVDGLVRKILASTTLGTGAIPIFPNLPDGFPIKVTPILDATIGTVKSLREMRASQRTTPLWDIEILFEELLDQTQNQTAYSPFAGYQQYEQVVQTWLMMYGQSNVFGFNCPWDNSRTSQSIGTGDGKSYIFTIPRTWGLGAQATTAPIGLINTVTNVSVGGGTIPSSHYYVSRNKIYFIGTDGRIYPPTNAQAITMTFSFYYLCRFVEDEQDFEEFAKNRWVIPSLKFRAVYWP